MFISLALLKERNPNLHRTVVAHLGFIDGVQQVDPSNFPAPIQHQLNDWVQSQRRRTVAPAEEPSEFQKRLTEFTAQKPTPPPAPPAAPATSPEPAAVAPPVQPEEQIDLAEYERELLQRATDEARGLARIEQYAIEQNLERSPENAAAITDWLDKNVKGYISAAGVDAAIQNLGPKGLNRLTWRKLEAPPPPAPALEPGGEVLADWQLPIDSGELTMKRASVKALQDLIKRRRAATNQKYIRCGFGSSF